MPSILEAMKHLIPLAALMMAVMFPGVAPAEVRAPLIRTEAGWTRAMPPGATVSAGYLRIRNAGPTADRLLAASSPAARSVELHETTMTDGDMQMREVERLELAPGAVVSLSPGGMHLMLIGLVKPLKVGAVIPLTLQFERAGRVDATLRVRPIGATGP
jgi:periplasmic copper chaperone A